jgi:hypothetical protein
MTCVLVKRLYKSRFEVYHYNLFFRKHRMGAKLAAEDLD